MKALNFLFLCTLVIATAAALQTIENGFAKNQEDPKAVEISVLSQRQANKLFKKFAEDKDIPFKYPLDGCYARATAMAQVAENEKVLMGKVFAEGSLQVKTDSAKYPFVHWGWHVAVIAYVKSHFGKTQLIVFDPSLFSKPVTVDEWKEKMLTKGNGYKAKVDKLYYAARFQYFPKYQEGNKVAWNVLDLAQSRETLKMYQPLQDFGSSANTNSKPGQLNTKGVH